MSHLGSNKSCKGEKSYATQRYYNNVELYDNTGQNHRESMPTKDLCEHQDHGLSGGHSEFPESMNPSVSSSHTAAVASAAAIYPRIISQQNRVAPSTNFPSFSHLPPSSTSSGHYHTTTLHSSALRHPPTLIPSQFNNSSVGIEAMWQQKVNPNPWILSHYEDMRLERTLSQDRERDNERQKEENRERHWDRLEREERERVQREAVQQHFEESLRLVLQKKNMGWNPSLSTTNKAVDTSSMARISEDIGKERSQYMAHERWLVQQQRSEQSTHLQNFSAMEARSGRNAMKSDEQQQMQGHRSSIKQHLEPSSSTSQIKNEVNFSLYGYQPVRQTYITQAQLKAREEKISVSMQAVKVSSGSQKSLVPGKNEKEDFSEKSSSPPHNYTSANKHQSKLVLSNHDRSSMIYQPLVGTGGAFKPYEFSSNSNSPAPPAHQNISPSVGRTPRYTQPQDQPQNLVKGDEKILQEQVPAHKCESRESKLIASTVTCSLPVGYSSQYTKSNLPANNNTTYSYSLIQQGLVPNPMYIASTHSNTNTNTSTPQVSFTHSQSSKSIAHPSSPPVSQQYACASPSIRSGSPASRPNSVPFTIPPGRINRSYSPVGSANSISGMVKGHNSQETHAPNRAHIPVQGSSHRSPSPAHAVGQQLNSSAPNSPNRSSPRMTNQPSEYLSSLSPMSSSPFHLSSQTEVSETSGIPLVKRKLLPETSCRKRTKPIDDGLLPPQLQPQILTSCQDTSESHTITPPDLVSNAPILGEQNVESYSAKSDSSSPLLSPNLEFKSEVTPPAMPDLFNSSNVANVELSDLENSIGTQNYLSFNKYKILNNDKSSHSSEDISPLTNNSLSNLSEKTSDFCEELLANTNASNVLLSSTNSSNSSCHPKLKKAWLQRHSENEDRKCPIEILKNDLTFQIKDENLNLESDECTKSEICKQITNSTEFIHSDLIKTCDNSNSEPASIHSFELNIEAEEDLSSSESDAEYDSKSGKRKIKLNRTFLPVTFGNGKRVKSGNGSDPTVEEPNSHSKKERSLKKRPGLEKESCIGTKKKGRKSKVRKSVSSDMKPPEKPSISQLKKSGESFLQDGSCCEVAPRLPKCRECRLTPHQRSKKMPNIFCRFYAYRKLRYGKNGTIISAGFSEPSDALEADLKLWLPPVDSPPPEIEIETSKFLLTYLGDQFCDLVEIEREAKKVHLASDDIITWKRVVQGVREMCDVCEATLFNIHWVCHKCGFVVCIDCFKSRKTGHLKEEATSKDRDEYQWLVCSNRQPHEQDKLMLTQIIAGTALWDVGKSLHDIRRKWNIPTYCSCGIESELDGKSSSNGINKLMCAVTKCFSSDCSWSSSDSQRINKRSNAINGEDGGSESGGSPLSWLNSCDDPKEERSSEENDACVESDDDKNEHFSTLRELLIRPTAKMAGKNSSSSSQKTLTSTLDEVISCVIEQKVRKSDKKCKEKQLLHFTRRYQMSKSVRESPPVRTCILTESSLLYPEIPHLWLGSGKILLLKDPYHSGNMQMFQEQWKRGQPVIIADVGTRLDPTLWTPDSFLQEFGDFKTDFFNCLCGTLLPNQPLRKFWEGFDNVDKRMKDDDGESIVLKLIDWPPIEEFSDILPSRFDDLMKVLPLPQYTHRDGVLNMASRLPECFVQPDLGPRMYNAYGISSSLGKGSTNLHLDVSDAINILAHVSNCDGKEEISPEIIKCLEESGCDTLMKKRAKERGSKPGALWHVYNARDADKIRDFLNKVSEEQGVKLNPHHDPIHNQEWYLDEKLRNRLWKEYGVEPYTIIQCLGDAIFIPAGSPHQVLNFQSCVKVAEDFVSPESVGHSFFLTQEIRNLSDNVINSEDRLQIKNIIYHAVKDALALLQFRDPEDSKT